MPSIRTDEAFRNEEPRCSTVSSGVLVCAGVDLSDVDRGVSDGQVVLLRADEPEHDRAHQRDQDRSGAEGPGVARHLGCEGVIDGRQNELSDRLRQRGQYLVARDLLAGEGLGRRPSSTRWL